MRPLIAFAAAALWVFAPARGRAQSAANSPAPPVPPPEERAPPAAAGCEDPGPRLRELLRAELAVDAHLLAETAGALCPGHRSAGRWRLLDSIALVYLEEGARARALLSEVIARGPQSEDARAAATLMAWSFWRDGDSHALAAWLPAVDDSARARLAALAAVDRRDEFDRRAQALPESLRQAALTARNELDASRQKTPWLAGTLSAVLPGLGQAYAGSWEGAAVALLINGVLIGATVELARDRLYLSAGATGMAASIFYVGNIFNAADLARRRNEVAGEASRSELERLLVPEASP